MINAEDRIPVTVDGSPFMEKYPSIILKREYLISLEEIIPVEVLYKSVIILESKLRDRSVEEGYLLNEGDLKDASSEQFAHILEHAILAVMDNNLSGAGSLSTGYTSNDGVIPSDGPNVRHGKEVELKLAPTIPPHLREEYVLDIIKKIIGQFQEDGIIDLLAIKL